ncbi:MULTISPECIES: glycoside hydrolase family 99-like domain-containing protein [unclassified Novosphingobium]|uniref:glycoside hydrolase family 99-like domain-containing protein n=1 Tax=unclassified Novosphingobium TaxID=2644732 RepID=UPI00135AFC75|nr:MULTISPECIES: glycoside hydrolase family 99-like domain-containing protein [unclassified Novosphingobium]
MKTSRLLSFIVGLGSLAAIGSGVVLAATAGSAPISIGVYYFPGWSPKLPDAIYTDPWAPIRKFPDRLPETGTYSDNSPKVMRRQLDDMRKGKLSFVVFDSYNGAKGSERLQQALSAYLATATNRDPKFALLWANHDDRLASAADWDALVETWLTKYLADSRYMRIGNRPVLFIFSPDNLERRAQAFGSNSAALLAKANDRAREHGMAGIAFVAGGGPRPGIIKGTARARGYAALSDYNMGTSGYPIAGSGYERRLAVYRKYWSVYRRDADLPVILPMTVGWDRKPWGGSKEDGAMSTPSEFGRHIAEGVKILREGNSEAARIGVICCWNEYGEGSVLEPTKKYGDGHLRALATALQTTNGSH